MLVLDIQRRLIALGYGLGAGGPAHDGVDGDLGEISQQAILAALATGARAAPKSALPAPARSALVDGGVIPPDWTPPASIRRIIVHWTAGGHRASALDRAHYHLIIEADGQLVRGAPSIALNDARGVRPGYAAHTLNCNTGSIGVALACMAGAVESPFSAGVAPMTRAQWDELPSVLAELCRRYGVAVTPATLLSHAEVQGTLKIRQRGKWDVARLAFDAGVVGAKACGDIFRRRTAALFEAEPSNTSMMADADAAP